MKVKTQDYNDATVVELHGEFTGDFCEMFRNTTSELILQNKRWIVLDVSNMSLVDSEALEQLLWLRDYCHENKCELKLAGLDENFVKILELTRLDKEFDRYTELAEAVKSFA